jgi:Family of unknown function (DUF6178)
MAKSETLLQRLLNAPDLTKIVPQLQPEVLHRVIQTCGLEDCADFVALATPAQLARILDIDIWRGRPGSDEQFDADRFGLWIAVLMEAGADVAAEKVLGLDIELVIAGLVQHAAAFDRAAVSSYTTLDGDDMPGRALNRGPVSEVGGYVLEVRRASSAWDSIMQFLAFLDAEHPGYFHRLMRGWVRLSDDPRVEDGCDDLLDDDEQDMFDLAAEREVRRERQGYVAPAQAHAFLKGGRDLRLGADRPARSAIARAYFRAIESTLTTEADARHEASQALIESSPDPPSTLEPSGVVEVLRDAGVLGAQPRALPGAADRPGVRLSWIEGHVASHPASAEELAYLANAILAGCSIQGRAFTAQEAGDGAVAICNLGLENWPSHWSDPDLVTAFQVGWTVLHRDVGMYVAQHLIDVLAGIRCSDRDIRLRLDGLRHELMQASRNREPWRARDALDVILMLDAPSWAALLALIDECPVIHAALDAPRQRRLTINPADFAFISQNSQIAAIREFMASLPSALAG